VETPVKLAWLALLCACGTQRASPTPPTPTPVVASVAPNDPPAPLACITKYYGGSARHDEHGWWLVLEDGTTVPYDDGKTKTVFERFESPDVEDVYELVYPTGPIRPITEVDFDPGRIRIDPLFMSTYGKTAKDVQTAMVSVKLGGKWFGVHKKIAEPVKRVAKRIDEAMKHDASLAKFFESPGGTFNWRRIAGTDTLSMHAWAIAIDLDTTRSHYWRNEPQNKPLVWKNSYPQAIVDAFEAEGFVWGGRWYHFDTMHFEYRPELVDPSCYPKRATD
jgi:hypothetical protein